MRFTPAHVAAFIFGGSFLLPLGSIVALLWANVSPGSYEPLARAGHFAVNDVGMTLFFGLAAKEIVEATAPGGHLHPISRAVAPVIAAVGGMAAPAALYLALVSATGQDQLQPGWAIPSATDIAFSFLIARWLFGPGHPAVPFLLLLAIADDALGLVVLALFYPAAPIRPVAFVVLLSSALLICWILKKGRVMRAWPYIAIGGAISWTGFFLGGLHPALALVPIVPLVPHAARDAGMFEEAPARRDPLSRFEHLARVPTEVVLFLFGLMNAGVPFANVGSGTWIVLAALVLGKPFGIVVATLVAERFGVTAAAVTRRDLVVIGCVAGIGFTVALFFCTAAFPDGIILDQTKMGALLSFAAAPVAVAAAALLTVGRFGRNRQRMTPRRTA